MSFATASNISCPPAHPVPNHDHVCERNSSKYNRDDLTVLRTNSKAPSLPTDRDLASASRIIQSFNTWAFKREQPDNPALLSKVVAEAVRSDAAIPFVLYWGKGPRREAAAPEIQSLDYLASLTARVRERHAPGASITLIFTDTHAALNGHDPAATDAYFETVRAEARARGFGDCRLRDLVESASGVAEAAEAAPSTEMLRSLTACAAKWFRGEGSVEHGALDYFRLNMIEKRAVEMAFPTSIFVTFNGSEFRQLFPADMPIFYMYSLRRGVGSKPWFLPSEPPAVADAPEAARHRAGMAA